MDENDRTAPPHTRRPQCCACGQPLRTGEPHWAGDRQGRPWHYGCAEKAGLTYSWFNLRAARVEAFLSPSSNPAGERLAASERQESALSLTAPAVATAPG